MATTPDEDQPQSPLQRASVTAATAVRSRGALAVALSASLALMTFAPQPLAAVGAFIVGLVVFDVARTKR